MNLEMPNINPQTVLSAYAAGGKGLFRITASLQKASPSEKHRRRIAGIASTTDKDLQDEVVSCSGLDTSYFMKSGYFNWNHNNDPGSLIGYPDLAKATNDELYVEGYLLENHKKADEVWELMNALELSKAERQLGMSIEGVVTERNLKHVEKAIVRQVAITHCPINQSTYVDIIKAVGLVAKTLNTQSGAPLRLENLDFGKIASVLFTTKCKRCYHPSGGFKKGTLGAYQHMVECNGFSKKESQSFLKYCAKGLSAQYLIALGFINQ